MNDDNQSTTVLVTGASGYIAMHCILQLLQQGYRVRGTLRSPSREQELRDAFAKHIEAQDRLEFVETDLMLDEGWADALDGCRFVLHIASPNLIIEPDDENAWVLPARDGALRVLQASATSGVERVVLTSSIAAIVSGHDPDGRIFTEDDWSNTDLKIGAYAKSKTLAEHAAWDFINSLPADNALELVVINPSYVIGPLLNKDRPASVEVVGKLLENKVPGCVQLGFPLVDVRDVAAAHLLAMTTPHAAGKRFISSAEYFWMQEIALILKNQYADRGYRIPTHRLPNILIRVFALFDASIKRVIPTLGQRVEVSATLLKSTLDWQPRSIESAIIDTAESLVEYG